jgi:hypothetical protein
MPSEEGGFEKEDEPVVRRESVELRLKELDEIIQELFKYEDANPEVLKRDLSQRWIIENRVDRRGIDDLRRIRPHPLRGVRLLCGELRGELERLIREYVFSLP